MSSVVRRTFGFIAGGVAFGASSKWLVAQDETKPPVLGPVEAPFERDYEAPGFKPSWKKPQITKAMHTNWTALSFGQ